MVKLSLSVDTSITCGRSCLKIGKRSAVSGRHLARDSGERHTGQGRKERGQQAGSAQGREWGVLLVPAECGTGRENFRRRRTAKAREVPSRRGPNSSHTLSNTALLTPSWGSRESPPLTSSPGHPTHSSQGTPVVGQGAPWTGSLTGRAGGRRSLKSLRESPHRETGKTRSSPTWGSAPLPASLPPSSSCRRFLSSLSPHSLPHPCPRLPPSLPPPLSLSELSHPNTEK